MRFERSLSCFVLIVSFAGCAREGVSAGSRTAQPSTVASPSKKEDTPRTSPADLVRQAHNLIASGDLRGAERVLEDCVQQAPSNRAALLLLSETTQREAQELERPASSPLYLRSASALRALRARYPDLTKEEQQLQPMVYYNEACTLALQGESAAAVKVLAEAVDLGFDIAQIEGDDELDSLRALPEFLALEARMERANAERLLTQSKPFPFDFTLPRADGSPLALSSLKGNVVLVAFGGTWCAPCRKEVPHLIELSRKYHGKGLEVVGIYLENGPSEEVAKLVNAYAKERAIPFPCVIGNESTTLMIPGFEGLPTLVAALDADGKVRLKLNGYQPLSALEAIATRLLEEKDSRPTSKN